MTPVFQERRNRHSVPPPFFDAIGRGDQCRERELGKQPPRRADVNAHQTNVALRFILQGPRSKLVPS